MTDDDGDQRITRIMELLAEVEAAREDRNAAHERYEQVLAARVPEIKELLNEP